MSETCGDAGNSDTQLASLVLDGQRRTNPRELRGSGQSLWMKPTIEAAPLWVSCFLMGWARVWLFVS